MGSLSLGKWFGIPVKLHWSFLLMLGLSIWLDGLNEFLVTIGLFTIVLLHEFGHCFAAMYFGVATKEILLLPIGGAAQLEVPKEPFKEFIIAIAGPMVNVALLLPLHFLIEDPIFRRIAICNVSVLVFNMLPVFPLDGGRVLRAILASTRLNHIEATSLAVSISNYFTIAFIALGIVTSHLMLAIVGAFIYLVGWAELESLKRKEKQSDIQAKIDVNNAKIAANKIKIAELNREREELMKEIEASIQKEIGRSNA
jgi:Zn-dependent protease